jgi:hypothetical protein
MLKPEQKYRPVRSFMSGPYTFIEDETLVYKRYEGYSHYDDIDSYEFHSETDGLKKCWLVSRKNPQKWNDFFKEVSE